MKQNRGFTLVELLVAVAIMGILTLLAIPVISIISENTNNSKYSKYGDSMVSSAKLYNDSYAVDLFGYQENGCQDIPYAKLKARNLIKDIEVAGISCDYDYTFVRIKKAGDKFEYQTSLYCTDEEGDVVHKDVISTENMICDGPGPEETPEGNYTCTGAGCFNDDNPNNSVPVMMLSDEKTEGWNTDKDYKLTVTVSDPDGLVGAAGFSYKWSTKADGNDGKGFVPLNYGNDEGVTEVKKKISRPEVDGTYYLVIDKTNIRDVLSNALTGVSIYGPYKFDATPPNCPSISPTIAAKTWSKKDIDFTFGFSADTKKYDWSTKVGTNAWAIKKSNEAPTVTKKTLSNEGKSSIRVKVYDVAGNYSVCGDTDVYYIDKTKPTVKTSTVLSTSDNLSFELADSPSGLDGYAITTSTSTPTSWTSISGTSHSDVVTKTSGTYYVHVKDKAGNTNYKEQKVVTMTAPSCTVEIKSGSKVGSWYNSDVKIKMTVNGTATSYGLSTSEKSTNGKKEVTHSSDGTDIQYYGYVANEAGSATCKLKNKFSRDTTAPAVGKRINNKVDHRQNGRFGYYFTDKISGIDKSETFYEYCYTGNTSSSCGATCSDGNKYSHNPATLNKNDKKYYQDGQFDFVTGNKDGSKELKIEGGIQTACLGKYKVRAYYQVCDRAENCTVLGVEIFDW